MEDTGVVKARFEETEAENTSAELVVNILAAVVQVGKAAVGAEIATFGVGNAAGAEAEIPVGRAAVGRAGVDLVAAGLVGHASAGLHAVGFAAVCFVAVEAVIVVVAVEAVIVVVAEADVVEALIVQLVRRPFCGRRQSLCGQRQSLCGRQ